MVYWFMIFNSYVALGTCSRAGGRDIVWPLFGVTYPKSRMLCDRPTTLVKQRAVIMEGVGSNVINQGDVQGSGECVLSPIFSTITISLG